MIINARLREFLHKCGHLDRFIKNTEAATYAPKVVTSIIEAFVWKSTSEGHEFWKFLDLAFDKERARYTIIEPKKYQGDDDSRAE
jgi:hypothetical protein